ncbi:MAG TPA: GNAT family N-acetyltransferase, partial [Anaerolineales bacterium]|nr:GNAT family N-acetyltransferase [Anaerolineales bacterium]
MYPIQRNYQSEEDYWRIRELLRQVSLYNNRHDFSWSLLRWDYWRWHINENIFHFNLQDVITIWEVNAQIVAVLNPDRDGEAFFQVHPEFQDRVFMSEMLEVAEEKLSRINGRDKKELIVWVNATDTSTKSLFGEKGYARSEFSAEHMRHRFISQSTASLGGIHDSISKMGYTVRALGDERELPARSWLSWKVFHPDEPDEKYESWEWYYNVQRVPLYRRDLDIVAVAEDGELAAFCTVWFDDVTRTAVFEPVGTHPNHQKRGLGKAVMSEGLRRAQRLGATLATVSSYSTAAHALYES